MLVERVEHCYILKSCYNKIGDLFILENLAISRHMIRCGDGVL